MKNTILPCCKRKTPYSNAVKSLRIVFSKIVPYQNEHPSTFWSFDQFPIHGLPSEST